MCYKALLKKEKKKKKKKKWFDQSGGENYWGINDYKKMELCGLLTDTLEKDNKQVINQQLKAKWEI